MVYDPTDGYVLLFGGLFCTNLFDDCNGHVLGDTWSFAAGEWTRLTVQKAPALRYSPDVVFDASDDYVLLWGGGNGSIGTAPSNDTWAFEGGAWSQPTLRAGPKPTSVQFESGMFYVPDFQAVFLYGGTGTCYGASNCNITWEYHAGKWTNLTAILLKAGIQYPGHLFDQSTTTDCGLGTGFMFGGVNDRSGGSQVTYNSGWILMSTWGG
jgi:hypothetical protein